MCQFFSFCMDEYGKKYYFDWEQRLEEKHDGVDSHDHIITKYRLSDKMINCFEFNPLTKEFQVDKINTIDNRVQAEEWVRKLDFKKIVEPLIIKPITNPFKGRAKKPAIEQVQLLKYWDSVRASVRASVWDSVWDSVRDSVRASVRDSVWDSVRASVRASVWDSVRDSVWDSVRASVRDSVRASVRDSVWDSVWDYISSFFNIQYKYDYTPATKLWEAGFVPSFDGKTWRLHSGKSAKIVYEWTKGE
jgi:hypothetical protein